MQLHHVHAAYSHTQVCLSRCVCVHPYTHCTRSSNNIKHVYFGATSPKRLSVYHKYVSNNDRQWPFKLQSRAVLSFFPSLPEIISFWRLCEVQASPSSFWLLSEPPNPVRLWPYSTSSVLCSCSVWPSHLRGVASPGNFNQTPSPQNVPGNFPKQKAHNRWKHTDSVRPRNAGLFLYLAGQVMFRMTLTRACIGTRDPQGHRTNHSESMQFHQVTKYIHLISTTSKGPLVKVIMCPLKN